MPSRVSVCGFCSRYRQDSALRYRPARQGGGVRRGNTRCQAGELRDLARPLRRPEIMSRRSHVAVFGAPPSA